MKRKNMVFRVLILIALVALALTGCGSDTTSTSESNTNENTKTESKDTNTGSKDSVEPIVIKINNDIAANSIKGESWRYFKEVLESKVGDKVDVQIYDSSSLYNQSEQTQALQQGNIQFMSPVPGVLTGQFPRLSVFGLPYLFKSPAMISEALKSDTIAGNLFGELEEKNVKVMSVWLNGWRMVSSGTPVEKIEDLEKLKIRVPGGENYVETFKALGGNVVTINWGEVPSSLQQGIIDAVEPTPNANLGNKIYETAPYITNTDHILDIYIIATSKEWFDSLPSDVQTAVVESIEATEKWNWEETTKANDEAIETMKANGAEFIKLSDEELAKWQEATLPVLEKFEPIVGKEVIQELQNLAKEYEWERP